MKIRDIFAIRNAIFVPLLLSLSSCIVHSRSHIGPWEEPSNSFTRYSDDTDHRGNVSDVNRTIVIKEGESVNNVDSVNGRVVIENGASARMIVSVNGRVVIDGAQARISNVETVNGRISAESGGVVSGTVEAINGNVDFTKVTVGESIKTSNGDILLFGVSVGANVETRNGDIRLENSVVENDLIIYERRISGLWDVFDWDWTKQEVIVGPDSEIKGTLLAGDEITLYVHETALINNIVGATPISYSGLRP